MNFQIYNVKAVFQTVITETTSQQQAYWDLQYSDNVFTYSIWNTMSLLTIFLLTQNMLGRWKWACACTIQIANKKEIFTATWVITETFYQGQNNVKQNICPFFMYD